MRAGRIVAGAAVAGTAAIAAPGAQAANFTVSNLNDAGPGSLRQAVLDANVDATADNITFAAGLNGQIALTTGAIPIEAALTIDGPGRDVITVSGEDSSRIFSITPDAVGAERDPVSISGLTLTKGGDSAIYTDLATLTIDDVAITDSSGSTGGGIDVESSPITITDSVMTGNDSSSGGGFMYTDGINAENNDEDTVTIRNTLVADNDSAGNGGALYVDNATGGDVLIEGSTFRGNDANGSDGGALFFYGSKGKITVRNSTISGNNASGTGGGIDFNSDYYLDGLVVENSTVAGDTSTDQGGGIYLENAEDDPVAIRNSTIAGNTSGAKGAGIYRADNPADISSTIVADNVYAGGPEVDVGESGTADGSFNVGNSLIEKGAETVTLMANPPGTNKLDVDPQLGALADNGGPTFTQLPALTSPAVDAGVGNGLGTDQRGLDRTVELAAVPNSPGSDGTDIGAVEIQDTKVDGATLKAAKKQKVKGKKVVVKIKVSAAEPVDVTAKGKIKAGKKSYGLKKKSASLKTAGKKKTLKLKPKGKKAAKKIAEFLMGGKKAKAKVSVLFTDANDAEAKKNAKVTLVAKKGGKKK